MTTREHEPPSMLLRALEAARALGRADGRMAFEFEPDEEPAAVGSCCHGLGPEEFSRLVWDRGAETAPAGVRINAPLWYALGFREALASARAQRGCRAMSGTHAAGLGQPPAREQTPSAPVRDALPAPPDRAPDPLGHPTTGGQRSAMTTTTNPSTTPVRRNNDRREPRAVISAPPRVAPGPATSTAEWVTYPGVRYAIERLDARRRLAAGVESDRVDHA